MNENWQEAARRLSGLKITQLTRQSLEEVVYDLAMYYDANKKRLLADKYAWTSSLVPDGYLVSVGSFRPDGVGGCGWRPDYRDVGIGVSLSRSVTKLAYLFGEFCVCLIQF